eukprot:12403955-Prorocentrum_lima.AAC.1
MGSKGGQPSGAYRRTGKLQGTRGEEREGTSRHKTNPRSRQSSKESARYDWGAVVAKYPDSA